MGNSVSVHHSGRTKKTFTSRSDVRSGAEGQGICSKTRKHELRWNRGGATANPGKKPGFPTTKAPNKPTHGSGEVRRIRNGKSFLAAP